MQNLKLIVRIDLATSSFVFILTRREFKAETTILALFDKYCQNDNFFRLIADSAKMKIAVFDKICRF